MPATIMQVEDLQFQFESGMPATIMQVEDLQFQFDSLRGKKKNKEKRDSVSDLQQQW